MVNIFKVIFNSRCKLTCYTDTICLGLLTNLFMNGEISPINSYNKNYIHFSKIHSTTVEGRYPLFKACQLLFSACVIRTVCAATNEE